MENDLLKVGLIFNLDLDFKITQKFQHGRDIGREEVECKMSLSYLLIHQSTSSSRPSVCKALLLGYLVLSHLSTHLVNIFEQAKCLQSSLIRMPSVEDMLLC